MYCTYFSLKVKDVVLHFQDANFKVSPPFSKSDVNDCIIEKLKQSKFIPDLNSLNYVIKEDQLFVEGFAYKEPEPTEFGFEI